MAYKEFTLLNVEQKLGVTISRATLFNNVEPLQPPAWLEETLAKGRPLAFVSEKSRSEFIVAPILLALRDLTGNRISIYSGERMDADPARGLNGECDFILTLTPPLPLLKSPIITMVEAKKNYVEEGLGQCIAQMVGAKVFNQLEGNQTETIFGCATTGEDWQFLKLKDETVEFDTDRYYIDNVGKILGVFKTIVDYFGT
jgi:hypothetical protein